ncbi:MAG: M67 family metallopeptidase [Magnetococcales bacterium]|nr:M67 family metallopeptidase [Magnetococcales bacterium]MBF0437787.1 M67 family metallopeptidase [Magnetococcales bacterium]
MWVIPRIFVNKMLAHAQRTHPRECVGVLTGVGEEVRGWHSLTNVEGDSHRFLADPAEQIELFRKMRMQGQEVVAIYHSHPNGPATPSAYDLEQTNYPEALTLIVAMDTEGRLEINGFLLREGRFEVQELVICD